MAATMTGVGTVRKADQLEKWSLAWSTAGLGMLVVIGLIAAWTLRQVNHSDDWVDHTYTVLNSAQQLSADLKNAESAARAYLVVVEDRFQVESQQASSSIPAEFDSLKSLTSDNPSQQRRLDELGPLLTSRIATLNDIMSIRKEKGLDAVVSLRRDDSRRRVAERVPQITREIQTEEFRLLRERTALRNKRLRQGLAGTYGAASLALIAFIIAPMHVRRAIVERDSANRERRESDSMVRSLFEAAPQAIIIADQDGHIVMANPETETIFGYKPSELLQLRVEVLIPEQLRRQHVAHRGRFFAEPQTRPMGLHLDLMARRKDASEFFAEISLSYIETAQGTLAVAFASDISKRRADELAICEQREELRLLAGKMMTAQEDERRRIARNLHDDLNQKLACLAMDLGLVAARDGFEEVATHLRQLQGRAVEAAELVRNVSHQLHPSILDDLGLKSALEEFCHEFEQRTGVSTQFTSRDVPDYLPSDISSCVYYIAGECLRNVSKHAKAQSVLVEIEFSGASLGLRVKDDGIGFSPEKKPHGGIGVAAMKERMRLLGGTFTIQSSPKNGTQVDIAVPWLAN